MPARIDAPKTLFLVGDAIERCDRVNNKLLRHSLSLPLTPVFDLKVVMTLHFVRDGSGTIDLARSNGDLREQRGIMTRSSFRGNRGDLSSSTTSSSVTRPTASFIADGLDRVDRILDRVSMTRWTRSSCATNASRHSLSACIAELESFLFP